MEAIYAAEKRLRAFWRLILYGGILISGLLIGLFYILTRTDELIEYQIQGTGLSFVVEEATEVEVISRSTVSVDAGQGRLLQLEIIPRLSGSFADLEGSEIVAEDLHFLMIASSSTEEVFKNGEFYSSWRVVERADFTPDDYVALIRQLTGGGEYSKTGDSELDMIAADRGYRAVQEVAISTLVPAENGAYLTPEASVAYGSLQRSIVKRGAQIYLTSGFRSIDDQQEVFNQIAGSPVGEVAINEALDRVAPPGNSRHHSGRAIDIVDGPGGQIESFSQSGAYAVLSRNNFSFARQFGFVPSYPEGAVNQGPLPEAWEFVYVGRQYSK